MEHASKLELLILDSLSDDTECVASIWFHNEDELHDISGHKLKNTIYHLYERGLIYIEGETALLDREDILAEEATNEYHTGNYYFGLTLAGVEFWEEARKECDEPVDWSKTWTAHRDYNEQKGYIDGTSREVCLNAFIESNQETRGNFKDWQVDMSSLVDSEIEGFQAKYYKYIPGGHRISFKLKRR